MTDGVDHINVYSRGNTEIGKALSNFAYTPFYLEGYGDFASIEGFWYWLSVDHPRRDELRRAYGYAAKKLGRELRGEDWPETPDFENIIKAALEAKLKRHKWIAEDYRKNPLPLKHYYQYEHKIIEPTEGRWVIAHLQKLLNE